MAKHSLRSGLQEMFDLRQCGQPPEPKSFWNVPKQLGIDKIPLLASFVESRLQSLAQGSRLSGCPIALANCDGTLETAAKTNTKKEFYGQQKG
jgi:hypothetical protein